MYDSNPDIPTKQCAKCTPGKYCKQCRAEYDRKYYEANRDKILKRKHRYYYDNHEKLLEGQRRYYSANRDKSYAAWQRRRARKRSAEGNFTPTELRQQYDRQKGRCYYCDCKLESGWHADHIVPLSRGGTNDINNIVCACPPCNLSKQDKLPHEWDGTDRLL